MTTGTLRLMVVVTLLALASCGGGRPAQIDGPADSSPAAPQLLSVGAKSASGAPAGIFVEWTRIDSPNVAGYYLYRYTDATRPPEPGPEDNPPFPIELRVNGGNLIGQPSAGPTVRFDDYFAAEIGETYYYRVTAVDDQVPPQESYPSNEMSWTVHGHNVTGLNPTTAYWGDSITITGDTFGATQSAGDFVRFPAIGGGEVDGNVTSWTDTEITASVPVRAVTGKVKVVIETTFAETDDTLTVLNPIITSIDPEVGFSEAQLTIFGSQFGTDQAAGEVMIGTVDVTGSVTSWADDEIWLDVPVEIEKGFVVVSVDGHPSNQVEFTPRPQILALTPASIQAGEPMTVQGRHFLETSGKVILAGSVELALDTWAADMIGVASVTAAPGLHQITVESSEGNLSNEFSLTVVEDLTVSLGGLNPTNYYTPETPPTVVVTTAADADKVELIVDDAVVAESTTYPFDDLAIPVMNLTNGEHSVRLKAYRRAVTAECPGQPVYIYSLPADINGDGTVDDLDTAMIETILWLKNTDEGFFPWFDPDEDNEVTEADNSAIGYNWGNSVAE